MMKLYITTGHFKKVPLFIKEMKRNSIPRNVLSYNLWMSAAHALSGVPYAEIIYKEMMYDKNVKVGWSTYCTLANFYIKSGLSGKALDSLKAAEGKLSTKNRLGYFFLITLYTALGNKSGVLRLWEASKKVPGRITCEHYKCVLSCLVKLGEITEAERVFMTWENKLRNYDVRVSNVLLSAYMRMGFMEKAEMLHDQTIEKGASPNYKTWEILMEGWVKKKEMPKAIEAMKNGCLLLEECNWRPPHTTLMAILQYFEEMNNIDDAMVYVEVLYKFKLTSLPIYHSLLRLHVRAQRPPARVLEMMEKDTQVK
ncbi:pentatricopeptide repeat-containing protein At5g27460 [Aristolochia californica]|uniref:pentatricopeptide repeat-containing protein At5g27460 n=1 Tax=Aristolochia californica TaxID=171875 RepID=UPI0035DFCE64